MEGRAEVRASATPKSVENGRRRAMLAWDVLVKHATCIAVFLVLSSVLHGGHGLIVIWAEDVHAISCVWVLPVLISSFICFSLRPSYVSEIQV